MVDKTYYRLRYIDKDGQEYWLRRIDYGFYKMYGIDKMLNQNDLKRMGLRPDRKYNSKVKVRLFIGR